MKRLVEFSVDNRVLVNLLILLVLGAGIISYLRMKREMFPDFSRQAIKIVTEYPGASPQEVEKIITIKIEEEVAQIDNIDELLSVSQESRSEILIKFHHDAEMSRALSNVRAALDKVPDFPVQAKEPEINEVKSSFPVITVSLSGDIDEATLRLLAKDIKGDLARLPGVGSVRILGIREKEIWVEVDPEQLDQYRLSLDDFRTAITNHNKNIPGGTLKTDRGEIIIRTLGEGEDVEDVKQIIIRAKGIGHFITIGDVAKVRETFIEATTKGRFNGKPAVNLIVAKKRNGDAIDIAARVRNLVGEMRSSLPRTVTLEVYNDFSIFIKNRLNTLRWTGGVGLGILLVILWFFVRTRIALLTGLGIPFSLLGAIILMSAYGISLNMVSLFGLILVLGLLVDDAVIVSENVYRYIEQGLDSRTAAIRGTSEVAWPVVATVATTVSAFIPLLMLPGMMGIFLAQIPIVVSFALFASILEVLLVLPSHLSYTITPDYALKIRSQGNAWLNHARKIYANLLVLAMRWRYITFSFLLCLTVILSEIALKKIPFVLFQEFESSQFFVNFETNPGAKIEDTLAVAKRAEGIILQLPSTELKSLATNVGITFLDVHRSERGTNLGQFLVELEEERKRNVNEIIEELRRGIDQVPRISKVQFLKLQAGPGGPAIEARVVGDKIQVLRLLAEEMKSFLKGIPGVLDVRDDITDGKEEIQITLRSEARALGLDLSQIARQVQQGFLGVEASSIQRSDEDIPIVIRFPEASRRTPETLAKMKLTLPSGERVFLRDIAIMKTSISASKIRRDNQKRAITVLADVDTRRSNAFQITERLKQKYKDLKTRFPGYRITVKGERLEMEESMAYLPQISLIAILFIYFILGSLFKSFIQPLIVMAVIPFALDGVIIGHLIMGEPLSFLSMIGLIALIGVVVNDSLILVDFINREQGKGVLRDQAIIASGLARLRPVLLTTLTTVGGLIPLAFFATGQAKFLSPMAISVVWGLSLATILTLFLVPCLYAMLDDIVRILQRWIGYPVHSTELPPP